MVPVSLREIKHLGSSVEHNDYDAYQYKGYSICLHLTFLNETILRLITDRDDKMNFRVHCHWHMGSEPLVSDAYLVLAFCIMLHCIENELVDSMPYDSNPRPIWNDDEFMKRWFNMVLPTVSKGYYNAVKKNANSE